MKWLIRRSLFSSLLILRYVCLSLSPFLTLTWPISISVSYHLYVIVILRPHRVHPAMPPYIPGALEWPSERESQLLWCRAWRKSGRFYELEMMCVCIFVRASVRIIMAISTFYLWFRRRRREHRIHRNLSLVERRSIGFRWPPNDWCLSQPQPIIVPCIATDWYPVHWIHVLQLSRPFDLRSSGLV